MLTRVNMGSNPTVTATSKTPTPLVNTGESGFFVVRSRRFAHILPTF